jgi:hypothetical protein
MSTPYVYHEGEATCINLKTGHKAVINLHSLGVFDNKDYELKGKTFDACGNITYEIKGRWDREIFYKSLSDTEYKLCV